MAGATRRRRAKERVFSLRDAFGQWDPRAQRPEPWNLYNTRHRAGEHFRVFPLSNWTELDIWQYIGREGLELPAIYLAHEREVFRRDGMLLAVGAYSGPRAGSTDERPFVARVRFRTVGDMTCTAAVESADGPIKRVFPPMSVVVRLADDLDIARGDMICGRGTDPIVSQDIVAMVCWMGHAPLRTGARLHLKHTSRWTRAIVRHVRHGLDVNSLGRVRDVAGLDLNDIGRGDLRVGAPLFFDEYRRNRATGASSSSTSRRA